MSDSSDSSKPRPKTAAVPHYTVGEEIMNSVTHGVGCLLGIAGLVLLIVFAALRGGGPAHMAAAIVYGVSIILEYLASTLYHAIQPARAKRVFRIIDHSCIYLLIAGSYTPFCLISLRGPWGWWLFAIVWSLAVIGMLQEIKPRSPARILSLVIYAVMGWIVLVAINPLLASLGMAGFLWLAAGGVFYTAGIVFFAFDERFRHWHGIWHLFVIAGSLAHFIAISFYVI